MTPSFVNSDESDFVRSDRYFVEDKQQKEIAQDFDTEVYRVWVRQGRRDAEHMHGYIQASSSGKTFVADPFYGFDGKKSFKISDDAISYIVDGYLLWSEVQYGSNQS